MNPEQTNSPTTNHSEQPTLQPVAAHASTPLWKDLLIPFSIIIAGVCIGLGLYLGGPSSDTPTSLPSITETTPGRVERLANDAGVATKDLASCLEEGQTTDLVQEDIDNAIATGGRGTPWSIIVGPTGTTYPINGALPVQAINQLVDIALAEGELPAELANEEVDTDAVTPLTEGDWVKGDRNAPVVVIEYSDFDCPFCGRFHDNMNQIVQQNDSVAWAYRHFPLEQLHPEARYVAEAAECVGLLEGEDAFWEFTDAYFAG